MFSCRVNYTYTSSGLANRLRYSVLRPTENLNSYPWNQRISVPHLCEGPSPSLFASSHVRIPPGVDAGRSRGFSIFPATTALNALFVRGAGPYSPCWYRDARGHVLRGVSDASSGPAEKSRPRTCQAKFDSRRNYHSDCSPGSRWSGAECPFLRNQHRHPIRCTSHEQSMVRPRPRVV